MFNWKKYLRQAIVASLMSCVAAASVSSVAQAEEGLGIGSAAPALDVEHLGSKWQWQIQTSD